MLIRDKRSVVLLPNNRADRNSYTRECYQRSLLHADLLLSS